MELNTLHNGEYRTMFLIIDAKGIFNHNNTEPSHESESCAVCIRMYAYVCMHGYVYAHTSANYVIFKYL